jgi:hypothetical protein
MEEREPGRWGDGAAEIVDVWLEDARGARQTALPQGEPATLRVLIRFQRPLEEPVFGVILKNERGEHVVVTNTLFEGVQPGSFEPGEEALYSVTFEVHLADGRYSASPAVAYQDTKRFADWREDAISFLVRGERHTGAIVDLPYETAVERVGAAEPVHSRATI